MTSLSTATVTTTNGLTARAEHAIRRASTVAVSFVALAAAILSFSGLYELAVAAGFHRYLAPLFPLATDLAVGAFSLAVLHHRMVGLRAWWPWLCMMLGVGVSIAGNVWAAPDDIVSRLVHAWPPLIFALSFETLTRLVRHRILNQHAAAHAATASAALVTAVSEPEAEDAAVDTGAVEVAARTEAVQVPQPQPQPEPAPDREPEPVVEAAARDKKRAAPKKATTPARGGTVREQIIEILTADPDITAAQIARDLGRDRSYVSKIVREVKKDLETSAADTRTDGTGDTQAQEGGEPREAQDVTAKDEPAPVLDVAQVPAPPSVIDVPGGSLEAVPFPETAPRLVPVTAAKNAVFEASGEDAARSASVWARLGLPSEAEASITQAQLDEALDEVRELEVAGVR